MTNPHNNSDDELEKLRMENELKKIKLMLEHGAKFEQLPDKQPVDPVIENEFLNYIDTFEKNYQDAEQIKLFDFMGRPEYIAEKEIPEAQIGAELDRIMKILNDNGIQLDTICEVEKREIYRFITEELFLHEIDNMRIPGMMSCFIYEEFHPNHEYDIKNTATEGVAAFLDKEDEYYASHFTKESLEMPQLYNFRDAYKSFVLHHFEITGIEIRGINASVGFSIDFTGTIEGSSETQKIAGSGHVELLYQYDFWYIMMIYFPSKAEIRKNQGK